MSGPDQPILEHIQELVREEQRLYADANLSDDDVAHLERIRVELDQYWDLLRQRRALRDAGSDPDAARLRDERAVENYEQ
jgi:hypothetical protein